MRKFKNDERGNGFIVMIFTVLVCLAFFELIYEVGNAYLARQDLQHFTDAAAMGGSVIAAEGYSNANGDGRSSAMIGQAKAQNKANDILKANDENRTVNTKKLFNMTELKYNDGTLDVGGDILNTTEQYYAGYFSVKVKAEYVPVCLEPFKNLIFNSTSRVRTVTE